MSDNVGADPHAEYRRQAAQHFGQSADGPGDVTGPVATSQPEVKPVDPPRIFRPQEDATRPLAVDPAEQVAPTASLPRPQIARILDESAQRFGAGTTYGGSGSPRPNPQPNIGPAPKASPVQGIPPTGMPSPAPRPTPQPTAPAAEPVWTARAPHTNSAPMSLAGTSDLNIYAVLTVVLAVIFPPLAIPVGHVTRAHVHASGDQGESLLRAGLILAYISLAVFTCLLLFSVGAELI